MARKAQAAAPAAPTPPTYLELLERVQAFERAARVLGGACVITQTDNGDETVTIRSSIPECCRDDFWNGILATLVLVDIHPTAVTDDAPHEAGEHDGSHG